MSHKNKRKYRSNNDQEFIKKTKTCTIECLLEIGKNICPTDFAVRFYYNKNHPKFYKQRPRLEKAIRRAYTQNAFNHKQQAEEIMKGYKTHLEPMSL